jgi:hypothetical protein
MRALVSHKGQSAALIILNESEAGASISPKNIDI